jgi:hypothetical protein
VSARMNGLLIPLHHQHDYRQSLQNGFHPQLLSFILIENINILLASFTSLVPHDSANFIDDLFI